MIIVDAGSSYKYGAFLTDKSDSTVLEAFRIFRNRAETLTGWKIRRLWSGAFSSRAWVEFYHQHGITHESSAPYSSAQNGLAERAIQTTIDDVRTLLHDSELGHSYWAEATSYSIDTRNLIPSRRHPGKIPMELFTGKRQSVAHVRVFGSKCWAKVPTIHGAQVTRGSKLDPRSVECRLLGYASGAGNYKVQDVATRRIYVSRDVVFDESRCRRTLASVGEQQTPQQIPLFDANILSPLAKHDPDPTTINDANTNQSVVDQQHATIPVEPRQSTCAPQPSTASLHSVEYQTREVAGKNEGQDWATNDKRPKTSLAMTIDCPEDHENIVACLTDTKALHHIP